MNLHVINLKRQINEFLFEEFRYDRRNTFDRISDSWPFELTYLGTINAFNEVAEVFEFTWRKEAFFITCERGLVHPLCWTVAGMTIADFQHQFSGRKWMGRTVGLDTAMLGEDDIPGTVERRRTLEKIAKQAPGTSEGFRIILGLYLPTRGCYVGLVEELSKSKTWVVSDVFPAQEALFIEAGGERAVSAAVGRLIERGTLSP